MSVTFDALEQALGSIESIGKGELGFDVAGVWVVLRVIPPSEEAELQRKIAEALESAKGESESDNSARALTYIGELKLRTVAHAIVEIAGLDLRNTPFVETKEKLPNGKSIKIPRAEAVRRIILKKEWSSTLLTRIFRKYGKLAADTERQAEKAIVFEPSDRTAEIERLRTRLRQLEEEERQEKEQGERAVGPDVASHIRALAESEENAALERDENVSRTLAGSGPKPDEPEPIEDADEPEVDPEQLLPPALTPASRKAPRQPILPSRAAPPAPLAPVAPITLAPDAKPQVPAVEESSFLASDPEVSAAQIEAENRRLLQARLGHGATPHPESALSAAHALRRPPHLDALHTAELAGLTGGDTASALMQPLSPEAVQGRGAPVISANPRQLPGEEIMIPPAASKTQVRVNPPTRGSLNPRFRPPGK